jgi:hypothetical protein
MGSCSGGLMLGNGMSTEPSEWCEAEMKTDAW